MRRQFPGYFRLSPKVSQELWTSGIISVDANVLLDFYRVSDDTRRALSKLVKRVGNRFWVTHQAASEFLDNRLGVISGQARAYEEISKALDRIEGSFRASRSHPFLTGKVLDDLSSLFVKVKGELDRRRADLEKLIHNDPILATIVDLCDGRIGDGLSADDLKTMKIDGEQRYKDRIPPGYLDERKPEGEDKFGDLILWSELIAKAKAEKKGVTLVTSERKDDWWWVFNGKMIGPRPELVAEMRYKAGVEFQMYSLDRFMDVASEKLGERVDKEAIEEVRKLREFRRAAFDERMERLRRGVEELRKSESEVKRALIDEELRRRSLEEPFSRKLREQRESEVKRALIEEELRRRSLEETISGELREQRESEVKRALIEEELRRRSLDESMSRKLREQRESEMKRAIEEELGRRSLEERISRAAKKVGEEGDPGESGKL